MTEQDELGPAACRLARERLLAVAHDCRERGRPDLAERVEHAATVGLEETVARYIVIAPRIVAVDNPGWEWLPNDWLIAFQKETGEFLTWWSWPLPEMPS